MAELPRRGLPIEFGMRVDLGQVLIYILLAGVFAINAFNKNDANADKIADLARKFDQIHADLAVIPLLKNTLDQELLHLDREDKQFAELDRRVDEGEKTVIKTKADLDNLASRVGLMQMRAK